MLVRLLRQKCVIKQWSWLCHIEKLLLRSLAVRFTEMRSWRKQRVITWQIKNTLWCCGLKHDFSLELDAKPSQTEQRRAQSVKSKAFEHRPWKMWPWWHWTWQRCQNLVNFSNSSWLKPLLFPSLLLCLSLSQSLFRSFVFDTFRSHLLLCSLSPSQMRDSLWFVVCIFFACPEFSFQFRCNFVDLSFFSGVSFLFLASEISSSLSSANQTELNWLQHQVTKKKKKPAGTTPNTKSSHDLNHCHICTSTSWHLIDTRLFSLHSKHTHTSENSERNDIVSVPFAWCTMYDEWSESKSGDGSTTSSKSHNNKRNVTKWETKKKKNYHIPILYN